MLSETYTKAHYHVIKIKEVLHLTSDINELDTIVEQLLDNKALHIAVHFMDGSYLCSQTGAVIVRCWENIKEREGTLALINVNKDILDFLKVIDIDSLIKLYDSEKDLEASFVK